MEAADQDRQQAGEGSVGNKAEPSPEPAAASPDLDDEPVVISSYLVNTRDGDVEIVVDRVSVIAGVEAHERFASQFVITIEAESIDASIETVKKVNATEGVINSVLVYANFEDDPVIKAQLEKNRASQKAKSEQAEG
ncbi:MAG: chaperone NapD [Coriobacteriia bacterium]|nr:chaperone NapD [Coriobacteriia bacterium]